MESQKILFINLPTTLVGDDNAIKYTSDRMSVANIPFGLLSICAYIEEYTKNKHELKIFDMNAEIYKAHCTNLDVKSSMYKALESVIDNFRPDIIGISVMFDIAHYYLEDVVAKIRSKNSNSFIFAGGNVATTMYKKLLNDYEGSIDAICIGEGELPIKDLLDSENIKELLEQHKAWSTKESIDKGKVPSTMVIENLDEIPTVNFDLLELRLYTNEYFNAVKVSKDTNKKSETNKVKVVNLPYYTSRGCCFNCSFCAAHVVNGKKVRYLSIERIVKDIKIMIERHGLEAVHICDDNFILDKKRAISILHELKKLNIKLSASAMLVRNIDDNIAKELKEVGIKDVLVSIESGSEHVLKNIIDKPLNVEQIFNAVSSLRKYGMNIDTNIVTGFPSETDEHRKETLKLLEQVGFDWVHILIALPVPGSRLYKECDELGYIVDKKFVTMDFRKCNIRTPQYEPEHVEWQAYMMNLHANFVYNYNMKIGNFDKCITQYENVLRYFPDHAFAYYGLMKAYEGKGVIDEIIKNKNKFKEICNKSSFWLEYAKYFNLEY